MWEVWYGLEAANYLEDNGALVADLSFAVESLAENAGWPKMGVYHQFDDLVAWEIARHLVIYQRVADAQIVHIAAIKPD